MKVRANREEVLARLLDSASRPLGIDELGAPRRKSSSSGKPRPNKRALQRAVDDAIARMKVWLAGDREAWQGCTPATIVGLYTYLHFKVYGVEALEMADDWAPACSKAGWLLTELVSGVRAAGYLKWVFATERAKIVQLGSVTRRIGWRLAFSKPMVVDYRVKTFAPPKRRASR